MARKNASDVQEPKLNHPEYANLTYMSESSYIRVLERKIDDSFYSKCAEDDINDARKKLITFIQNTWAKSAAAAMQENSNLENNNRETYYIFDELLGWGYNREIPKRFCAPIEKKEFVIINDDFTEILEDLSFKQLFEMAKEKGTGIRETYFSEREFILLLEKDLDRAEWYKIVNSFDKPDPPHIQKIKKEIRERLIFFLQKANIK